MTAAKISAQTIVGYLSIIDVPHLGHCGGLLIVNLAGRPIEFHCTSPVAENRAQRILYGNTYQSFLFCDQIGRALIDKAKKKTQLLIVDQTELLPLNDVTEQPVVQLLQAEQSVSAQRRFAIAGFDIGHQLDDLQQTEFASDMCQALAAAIPLDEPFERIRMAIDEAQSVAR